MNDITTADREAVDRLIDMVKSAKEEQASLDDCHDIWRQAFAAHRIAAVAAERERIVKACELRRDDLISRELWEHASGVNDALEAIQTSEATQ